MVNYGEYDVIVSGGGIAGIAAALSAGRNGAKVLLIEKQCILGGLATLGLITYFLPLCDGEGNQVIYGLGEELLKLSIRHGCEGNYPKAWLENGTPGERKRQRYEVRYNPSLFALEAERLLVETGVEILYDTWITGATWEESAADAPGPVRKRLRGVKVRNKSGEGEVYAKAAVDCTGDGDLIDAMGLPTACFDQNKQAAWYYGLQDGELTLRCLGAVDKPAQAEGEERQPGIFQGLDGMENSRVLINAHRIILADVKKRREKCLSYVPVQLPGVLQVRMTRRLRGAFELGREDVNREMEDSIGMTGDWRAAGRIYQIPFRCLYHESVGNLAVAGRCISVADDDTWDVTRVIPCCCVTGQAAGLAAALVARENRELASLDVHKLQNCLEKDGVRIRQASSN